MSEESVMGRPEEHGLEVITGDRLRRARFALCTGGTRIEVAKNIFKVSPKTLRRYMSKDDIRSKILKRSIEEGEALRNEPLGTLICYLLDQKEEALSSMYMYQLPENEGYVSQVDFSSLADYFDQSLLMALADNEEVRDYQEVALKVERNKKRSESLEKVKRDLFTSQESIITKLRAQYE